MRRLLLFTLLSLTDFALTRHLLAGGGATAYEGNLVAAWRLAHFGWFGLATFKTATVLTVAVSAMIISPHRPLVGNNVLIFACAALTLVVGYCGYLCTCFRGSAGVDETSHAAVFTEADRFGGSNASGPGI
jgi:hypothetical protein